MIRKPICWIPIAVSYAVLAWFVYFVINPLCYNIFQQPAFVLTFDFFWSKVGVPGGLSEYMQTFIDQFTMFRFWGTLFLVLELFATAFLTSRLVRKLTGDNEYVWVWAHVLAVALMFVTWIDVKYAFVVNMKALLLVAVLNIHLMLEQRKWYLFVAPFVAIFIYMSCGPTPLYIFAVCCGILYFYGKSQQRLVNLLSAVAVSLVLPFVIYKFVLPISSEAAFYKVFPHSFMYTNFGFTISQLFILLFIPILLLIGIFKEKILSVLKPLWAKACVLCVLFVGVFFLAKNYDNPMERLAYKMEVAAYHNDWDKILSYVKKNPKVFERKNYDRNVNFYYCLALAEKNQLADKMFNYPQMLGIDALFLDEPVATSVCLPVAMFYYDLGLVTNALHYAFEAQTTFTSSHYTMRYVVDCLIIIGDYDLAKEFLTKYEKTMFSRKYVAERLKIINGLDNVDSDFTLDYLRKTREAHVVEDFYMHGRQNNMLMILMANRENKVAAQYIACSLLLQNDLESFIKVIKSGILNIDNNNLPKAYQEAIILYLATAENVDPEIEQIKLSSYIRNSFSDFARVMTSKPENLRDVIDEKFPKTYWRYFYFDNPIHTNSRLLAH